MTLPRFIGADAINIADGLPATSPTFEVYFEGSTTPATLTNTPAQVNGRALWQVELTTAERDNDTAVVAISGTGVVEQSRHFVNYVAQGFPANMGAFNLDASGQVKLQDDQSNATIGAVDSLKAGAITAASIVASALDGKGDWNIGKTGYDLNPNQGAVTIGTVTTNTDMRGTDNALLASSVNITAGNIHADLLAWQGFVIPGAVMVENDGGGNGRFTTKALEQGPSGGGGTSDWTVDERKQIREALGVNGDKTIAATGGQLQNKMNTSHIAATGGKVDGVALVDTTTANSDMRGTDNALTDKDGFTLSPAGNLAILQSGDIDGLNVEQAMRPILANAAGQLAGAATNTNTIKNPQGTIDRITATVDASGNRTAIVLDVTP